MAEFPALQHRLNSYGRVPSPSVNDVFLSRSSSNQSNWDSGLLLDPRNELSRFSVEIVHPPRSFAASEQHGEFGQCDLGCPIELDGSLCALAIDSGWSSF